MRFSAMQSFPKYHIHRSLFCRFAFSFATYVGWYAVAHLFPEWNIWTSFVGDDMARALSLDGLRSSHPIHVPVHRPSEITQVFDAIRFVILNAFPVLFAVNALATYI
jgi:hypothetical protein